MDQVSSVDVSLEVISLPPEFKMCFQLALALFLMICPGSVFLHTAVFLKWLDLMAWELFFLLPEVLVPVFAFLCKRRARDSAKST